MTDEGSVPPLAPEAPAPLPEATLAPALPQEAVAEISEEITEAVQEALTQQTAPAPAAQTETPPAAPAPAFEIKSLQPQALSKRREDKRERIDKIMELRKKKTVITNNDVQWYLGVSDVTATRYIKVLENEGKLERFGIGSGTRYRFV